jgi:hypothetical protein
MDRPGLWHRGTQKLIVPDNPPAGREWLIRLPPAPEEVWWKPLVISFTLQTSAAVANRNSRVLYLATSKTVIGAAFAGTDQAASLTYEYTFSITGQHQTSLTPPTTPLRYLAPLPHEVMLRPGHEVQSETSLINAADQYSNVRMLVEEWVNEYVSDDPVGRDPAATMEQLLAAMERVAMALESRR